MTDLVDLQRRAADEFGRRVDAVADDQWGAPTPCTDWDVRALVNHVVSECLWAPELMAGRTIAEVGDRFDGDVLGDDPKAAWHDSVPAALAAFAEGGALDRTVHLSYGDESAREYATQLTTDFLVHAWDLARAIGADEALDADVVRFVLAHWTEREQMVRMSGVFGHKVPVADDASDQDRLLALLGRRP